MRRFARSLVAVFLGSACLGPGIVAATSEGDSIYRDLPRDPLVVLGTALNEPASELGSLVSILDRLQRASDDDATQGMMPDSARLIRMHQELLPYLGPELALVIDLPPIDQLLGTIGLSPVVAASQMLGEAGLVARVRDAEAVEMLLRRWSGGSAPESGERSRAGRLLIGVDVDGQSAVTPLELFYRIEHDRLALGFSSAWVEAAVTRRAKGQRLGDGDDFKRVFANLDPHPSDLTYVNLPKLRSRIADSQLMLLALQSNAELGEFFDAVMTEQAMAVGIGSSSVTVDGGVRTTHFGPRWMSGTAVSSGFLAALALPSLMTAVDRGRAERTSSDVLAIAEACQGFSSDSRRYPGPTKGWVPVEQISAYLEPIYIGQLPTIDGWRNPIMYWSDGGSFRVLSTGRDGAMDRDWSVTSDRRDSSGPDGDIVFSDDGPVAWPVANDGH